jgi:hypothetical protein
MKTAKKTKSYLVKVPAGNGLYRCQGITENPSANFESDTSLRFLDMQDGRAYRLIAGSLFCVDANTEPSGV